MNKILKLKQMIESARKIVVFTGAGISVASGIPDFRSASGIYNKKSEYGYPPEQIISHSFFEKNPEIFFDFYKNKMVFPKAKPNAAHIFFANLEKDKDVTVVTQNVDDLHQRAGSSKVYPVHGTVAKNYCIKCKKEYDVDFIMQSAGIPKCEVDFGIVRPDIVLYEESLNAQIIEDSIKAIENADMLIVVGTSLVVYPAAGFIRYFKGNNLVLINKSETPYDHSADLVINEDITKVVEQL
ncbi:MAG: NAD-dependent protein deacylase [Clostridia bacterium]|nr:NAD-dependent protein deacylase [Clostridia bacterium]